MPIEICFVKVICMVPKELALGIFVMVYLISNLEIISSIVEYNSNRKYEVVAYKNLSKVSHKEGVMDQQFSKTHVKVLDLQG